MNIILVTGIPGTGKTDLKRDFHLTQKPDVFLIDTDESPFLVPILETDGQILVKFDAKTSTSQSPYKWRLIQSLFFKTVKFLEDNKVKVFVLFGVFRNIKDIIEHLDHVFYIDPSFEFVMDSKRISEISHSRKQSGRPDLYIDIPRHFEILDLLSKYPDKLTILKQYDPFNYKLINERISSYEERK